MLNSLRSRMLIIVIISMTIILIIVASSMHCMVTKIFSNVIKGVYIETVFFLTQNMIQHEREKAILENQLTVGSSELSLHRKEKILNEINDNMLELKEKPITNLIFLFIFDGKKNVLLEPYGRYKDFISSCYNSNGDKVSENCLELFITSEKNKKNNQYGKSEVFSNISASKDATLYKKKELSEVYTIYIKNIDWYISIIWPKEYFRIFFVYFSFFLLIPIFFFFLFFIFSVSCLVSRAMRPLELLSQRIVTLSDYDFTSGDTSELKRDLPLKAKNEIGKLARTFAVMTDKLTSNIRQLVATTALAERMQSELNVARKIQLDSLPKNFSFPPDKAVELYAYLIPAREIGGDLYDFFFVDERHLCIAVGDVADKGVPAALFMTVAKKLISSTALQKGGLHSPGELVNQLNEILCYNNSSATFVTLFFGILDVTTGTLRYVNGGHVPPVFTDETNNAFFKKELSGPVVGVIPNVKYKEISVTLPSNGSIFLCSDGITEAMDEEGRLFGEQRMLQAFVEVKDFSCDKVIEQILHEVKDHAGNAAQSDDITMMMIRWKGKNEKVRFKPAEG